MKLYYFPGSCSLASHITLREAGLDFSLEKVDLKNKTTEHGQDFLRINPKGQVPALILDNQVVLTEGPAIMQYIADIKPDRRLVAPVGSLERYHQIEWLNYIATEIHQSFAAFSPRMPVSESYRAATLDKLFERFTYVNNVLSTRPYIAGDHFTVADAYLFTIYRWRISFRLPLDFSKLDYLNAYEQKIEQRPHVQDALKAEGLI
ncbi:MAG: glutathione transferase GstA [Enterobacteriaceae bacterium]|nr:glutathione transferase GstA [Enterobacteriaceae bacterium]